MHRLLLKSVTATHPQSHLRISLSCSSYRHQTHRFASTFRAAVVKDFGKPLVIEPVKSPKLASDEVRISVYCCGINSLDVSNVNGELEPKPKLPFIPGYEVRLKIMDLRIFRTCLPITNLLHLLLLLGMWRNFRSWNWRRL